MFLWFENQNILSNLHTLHQPFPEVFQNSAKLAKWLFPIPCAVKIQNLQGKKNNTPLV